MDDRLDARLEDTDIYPTEGTDPILTEMQVEMLLAMVEVRLLECDPHTDPPVYIEQLQEIRVKLIEIKELFFVGEGGLA